MRMLIYGLFCLFPVAAIAQSPPPDQLVRTAAEEVFKALHDNPAVGGELTQDLVNLIESKILPHFDFEGMARLALARNWNRASDIQKSEFVMQFQTLLVRTYSSALFEYKDATLEYLPLTVPPGEDNILVRTRVKRSPSPIEINYRMQLTQEGWKAYDVLVDGVSLVINYRSAFNTTIERIGIDGLIRDIAQKNTANALL